MAIKAQTMRAILLAKATRTSIGGLQASMRAIQEPAGAPWRAAQRGFGAQFGWWAQSGSLDALSGAALRHRHPEPGHPIEHRAADPGFGLLGRQRSGAQAATNDSFVAKHGRLPKRAPAVADRLLPAQAPLVPDHLAGRG